MTQHAETRRWHHYEDILLTFIQLMMVMLPVTEVLLRGVLREGISNAASVTQHLVLVLGMFGAMTAAREQRLLAFAGLFEMLPRRWQPLGKQFTACIAISISLWLSASGMAFVLTERESGHELCYGIPIWWLLLTMPLGFASIAFRILYQSTQGILGRSLVAAACVWLAMAWRAAPEVMPDVSLVLLVVAAMLGTPMFIVLGGAALILFASDHLPTAAVPLSHYQLTVNPSLPAVPLFTLAGYLLAESGAPQRLIRLFQALLGRYGSGNVIMAIILSAFFTSFTGASGVTILALGGLLMPMLLANHYPRQASLGLLTSAPALGTLLPPALPLIIYAIIARQPIETMFLAGLIPSLVMTLLLTIVAIRQIPQGEAQVSLPHKDSLLAALGNAKWELAIPFMACASLFSGWMTPVETAAFTAAYAFIVEVCIHRDLDLKHDIPRVMSECGLMVGGIILILGTALGVTNYVADAQIPELASAWVEASLHSPWSFLLVLNLLLLLVGMLMDIFSAIVVITPLIAPMGAIFGIDPIHLGVLFLANLELGFLTPPVGLNLFFASYRFGAPLSEVAKSTLPSLLALAIGVMLISYIPALSTWLPELLNAPRG